MTSHDETLPMAGGDAADSLEAGQLFGRYLVVEHVGAGGVGEVFAAYDPTLDRRVALKVMRKAAGGSASSPGEAGLVREAKALASLSHPNVVTVHEVGREDGRVYVGDVTVDALGYGSFASAGFEGEGAATPDANPDRSVARLLSVVDTDDNAVDFTIELEPTPGAVNH